MPDDVPREAAWFAFHDALPAWPPLGSRRRDQVPGRRVSTSPTRRTHRVGIGRTCTPWLPRSLQPVPMGGGTRAQLEYRVAASLGDVLLERFIDADAKEPK